MSSVRQGRYSSVQDGSHGRNSSRFGPHAPASGERLAALSETRSLEVRRFCNLYKPSAFANSRPDGDESPWTLVDTEHLLAISTDMAKLSNYLVERVVAAS